MKRPALTDVDLGRRFSVTAEAALSRGLATLGLIPYHWSFLSGEQISNFIPLDILSKSTLVSSIHHSRRSMPYHRYKSMHPTTEKTSLGLEENLLLAILIQFV